MLQPEVNPFSKLLTKTEVVGDYHHFCFCLQLDGSHIYSIPDKPCLSSILTDI